MKAKLLISKKQILNYGIYIVIFNIIVEVTLYKFEADIITHISSVVIVSLLGIVIALSLELFLSLQYLNSKILKSLKPHCFEEIKINLEQYETLSKFASIQINIIENCIKPLPDGFKLKGDVLPLASYVDFWRFLVKEQTQINHSNRQHISPPPHSLKAIAIHSCSFDIWLNHPLTEVLYRLQQSFIEAGGSIIRILCSEDDIPNNDVISTCQRMKEHKIDVWYYNINCSFLIS
jgi:hypothetical protein